MICQRFIRNIATPLSENLSVMLYHARIVNYSDPARLFKLSFSRHSPRVSHDSVTFAAGCGCGRYRPTEVCTVSALFTTSQLSPRTNRKLLSSPSRLMHRPVLDLLLDSDHPSCSDSWVEFISISPFNPVRLPLFLSFHHQYLTVDPMILFVQQHLLRFLQTSRSCVQRKASLGTRICCALLL